MWRRGRKKSHNSFHEKLKGCVSWAVTRYMLCRNGYLQRHRITNKSSRTTAREKWPLLSWQFGREEAQKRSIKTAKINARKSCVYCFPNDERELRIYGGRTTTYARYSKREKIQMPISLSSTGKTKSLRPTAVKTKTKGKHIAEASKTTL